MYTSYAHLNGDTISHKCSNAHRHTSYINCIYTCTFHVYYLSTQNAHIDWLSYTKMFIILYFQNAYICIQNDLLYFGKCLMIMPLRICETCLSCVFQL